VWYFGELTKKCIDLNVADMDTLISAVEFLTLKILRLLAMNHQGISYAKKGTFIRLAYLFFALLSFVLRRMFCCEAGVVVLCYHSVTTKQFSSFKRQMQYIKERAVSLDHIHDASDSDTLVAVTFDDAFECLLDNVVPVVRDLQVPIAIFAVSGNLGKSPVWLSGTGHPDSNLSTMSAEQLRKLAEESGCIIGSHTASHRRLGDLPTEEVDIELATSKASLENVLGVPCQYLALPHGSYRPNVIELAILHDYRKILTLDEIAFPSCWPEHTIGRFTVSPDMWMIEFVLTVHGAYAWLYAWRSWVRRMRLSFAGLRHAS
jgi:peptidoglycan/xylan/chitin deacetylase (PgdA/CDA1 family)